MPVIKRKLHAEHPKHADLLAELVRHLQGGPDLPEMPRIIEEDDALSKTTRVYVLWEDWASVTERERSEIILEAYQQAFDQQRMLQVTVAMGVTPTEAANLGLKL